MAGPILKSPLSEAARLRGQIQSPTTIPLHSSSTTNGKGRSPGEVPKCRSGMGSSMPTPCINLRLGAWQGKSASGWNGQAALTLVAGGILPNIRAVPGEGQYPRCAKMAPCISCWRRYSTEPGPKFLVANSLDTYKIQQLSKQEKSRLWVLFFPQIYLGSFHQLHCQFTYVSKSS